LDHGNFIYIVNNIPLHILTNTPKLTICEWVDTETTPKWDSTRMKICQNMLLYGIKLVAIVMMERID